MGEHQSHQPRDKRSRRLRNRYLKGPSWGLLERVGTYLFALVIVLPALLFGGVLPLAKALVTTALAISAALIAIQILQKALPARVPSVTYVLLAAGFLALTQSAPLGPGLVSALHGPLLEKAKKGLDLLGLQEGWGALSFEPTSSIEAAAHLFSCAAILVISASLTSAGRGRTLLHATAILGAIEVAAGLFHALTAPQGLSLFYDSPLAARPGFHTTLLNDNHTSSLFNLVVFVFVALALDRKEERLRHAFLACAFIMVVASFLTFSRGGIMVLTFVAIIGGALLLARNVKRRLMAPALLAVTLILAAASSLVWFYFADYALKRYAHTSLEVTSFAGKGQTWAIIASLALDHSLLGVGPWALESASGPYTPAGFNRIEFAENVVLQSVADYGIPIGVGLVIAFVVAFIAGVRQWRWRPSSTALFLGLLAVGLQNVADFSLEVPGVAFPTAAVAGYLLGHPGVNGNENRSRPLSAIIAILTLVITTPLLLAFALPNHRLLSYERMKDLVERLEAGSESKEEGKSKVLEQTRKEASLRPLDSHLYALAGRALALAGDLEGASDLLCHSLELRPHALWPSIIAIRVDTQLGRISEAVARMRTLLEVYPAQSRRLYEEIRTLPWPEDARLEVFRNSPRGLEGYLRYLAKQGDFPSIERLLLQDLKDHPQSVRSLEWLGRVYMAQGRHRELLHVATQLMALRPDRASGYQFMGESFLASGYLVEALTMFREAAKKAKDPTDAQLGMLRCLLRLKEYSEFDAIAEDLISKPLGDTAKVILLQRLRAEAARAQGRSREALRILEEASRLAPLDPSIPLAKAKILRSEGRIREAILEYRRAFRLNPKDQSIEDEIKRLSETTEGR